METKPGNRRDQIHSDFIEQYERGRADFKDHNRCPYNPIS